MKKLILLIILLINNIIIAQSFNTYYILDKAGQQRILCEQMTKNYLQIAINFDDEQVKTEFEQKKIEFNENLNILFRNLRNEATKEIISQISDQWLDLKVQLNEEKSILKFETILTLSNTLSATCNTLILNIYRENDCKNARTLNIISKQKLNMQRLMTTCIKANVNELGNNKTTKEIDETIASIEFNQQLLKSLCKSESQIQVLISKSSADWATIKPTFELKSNEYKLAAAIENAKELYENLKLISNSLQNISLANNALTKK